MDDTVTLTREEYQALIDARDHAVALRQVATGAMDTLTEAELDRYMESSTPLAFWRRHRGLTQVALAAQLGISQVYLSQIETGQRTGEVLLYAKLAKALRVRMEDLVAES